MPAGTLTALAEACRMHSNLVLLIISRLVSRAVVLLGKEYVSADLPRAVTGAEHGRFHPEKDCQHQPSYDIIKGSLE